MSILLAVVIAGLLVLMALVRLAPADPAAWHQAPDLFLWEADAAWDNVIPLEGGAALRLSSASGDPADLLARLDGIAMATPRTTRLAGNQAEGMITWQTRSLLWGFPDYTTAQIRPDGLYVYARLRFGRSDLGVNAKRLQGWLAALAS